MINFKKVELTDKKWMDPLLKAADLSGCHQNFTNIFAWSETYKYQVAQVNDYLVVKSGHIDNEPAYFWPAGSGDIKPVLEVMKQDAIDRGCDFILAGISPENMTELRSLYPDNFEYKENRDAFDYVYSIDKLISLSGNKLHSKRNHINRFKENESWSFESITLENLAECWEMNKAWCEANKYEEDEQLVEELCAVRQCFKNFVPLGLEGGLLRLDGRIIAFTMGDKLNGNTFDTHIEKAFGEIQGAYQMINREFAVLIKERHPEVIYVNREEDMGYEGLRKAKLSYYPVKLEEKFWAKYIQ
jgi:hypothetical protein